MFDNAEYACGVVAVKETFLLGEKLLKLSEGSADEAKRTLAEWGFLKADDESDVEASLYADEEDINSFVREYASPAAKSYLLTEYDYHNAKAAVKSVLCNGAEAFAPNGLKDKEDIKRAVEQKNFNALGDMASVVKTVLEGELSGAETGYLFTCALYSKLLKDCKLNPCLKNLLIRKIDLLNILSAKRAGKVSQFIPGGRLKEEEIEKSFESGEYENEKEFFELAEKSPVLAERYLNTFEGKYFYERRFDLKAKQPVLYYALKRRAENSNVRIILACLSAGVPSEDIKMRLREI